MDERARAALKGAVVGATLGAPRRGARSFVRLNGYDPVPRRMASSLALDAWLVFLRHLNRGLEAEEISRSLARHWASRDSESAYGAANHALGFTAPLAGAWANPLSSGSESLGRSVFWGVVFPDDPDRAAEHAARDAGYDHGGSAVLASCVVAALVSIAAPSRSAPEILGAVASLAAARPDVGQAFAGGRSGGDPAAHRAAIGAASDSDEESAIVGLGYVVSALASGEGDFARTICTAAGHGGPAHQSTMVAGAVAALLLGSVPDEWTAPLGSDYVASHALREIDPPNALADFAAALAAAIRRRPAESSRDGRDSKELTEPLGTAARPSSEADKGPPETPSLAGGSPPIPAVSAAAFGGEGLATSLRLPGYRAVASFPDGPVLLPGRNLGVGVTVTAEADSEPRPVAVRVPDGLSGALRPETIDPRPGKPARLAVLLTHTGAETFVTGTVSLAVGPHSCPLPVVPAEEWWVVGPLPDPDRGAYERTYAAEERVELGAVFNGRSGLPTAWERVWLPPRIYDVEPFFRGGPGVVLLSAVYRLAEPGRYRVLACASPGLVVTAAGRRVVGYRDTHLPTPRARPPYVGELYGPGEARVVVKAFRDREPVAPLTLVVFDPTGTPVPPSRA